MRESRPSLTRELPDGATERVREAAVKIFNAVDGYAYPAWISL